jgi:hypothetical protein
VEASLVIAEKSLKETENQEEEIEQLLRKLRQHVKTTSNILRIWRKLLIMGAHKNWGAERYAVHWGRLKDNLAQALVEK